MASKTDAPHVRLTYFDGRGLGELPRLCLAYAGVEFEDVRVATDDLPADFKSSGKLLFGQVPLLEIGDFKLVQSHAIGRHLARKYNFYGSTLEESALVDAVLDGIGDMRAKWIAVDNLKEGKEEAKAKFVAETLPHWYGLFSAILEKNGTGYLVGDKLSLADIQLFNVNWNWHNRKDMFPGEILKFPTLKAHLERIGAEPKIAAWVARRPASAW